MERQQAAYTKQTSPYPGYINVSREDDQVTITLRGDARDNGECGSLTTLKLTWNEWLMFMDAVKFQL